jgi:hypothetical protein
VAAAVFVPAGDISHEALLIGVDLVELAPPPGLVPAARTLPAIWDALRGVDVRACLSARPGLRWSARKMNRRARLRLTERCTDILYGVREEIADAGGTFAAELAAPIAGLVACVRGAPSSICAPLTWCPVQEFLGVYSVPAHAGAPPVAEALSPARADPVRVR